MTILQKAIKEILENSVSKSHAIEQNVILEQDFDKVAEKISGEEVNENSIINDVSTYVCELNTCYEKCNIMQPAGDCRLCEHLVRK